MTDEALREILQKHTLFETVGENEFSFLSPEAILSAMREAMRLESIGFMEWKRDQYIMWNSLEKFWFRWEKEGESRWISEELYNEYLNQSK